MWFHVLCYQILRLEEFLVNCGGGYKNIVFVILHKILCGKEFKRYGLFNKNGIEVSYCYQMTKNLRFPYMEKIHYNLVLVLHKKNIEEMDSIH